MKNTLFALTLALAFPISAQTLGGSALPSDADVEVLAGTLLRLDSQPPASAGDFDASGLAQKMRASTDASCTTYTLPYAGVSGGNQLWGFADRYIPSASSCYLSGSEPWDFWSAPAKAGEQVTIAVESTVRTFFSIDAGSTNITYGVTTLQPNGKYLGGYVWNVPSWYSGSTVQVAISPYSTSARYTLAVGKPVNGGGCTPTSTTACVLNNRFQVKVRYRGGFDNNAADTDALVKPVTGFANSSFETAFFYFNSSNNIEMMLKMLDQGNTDTAGHPTIAVLFGSATPLRMELTITDTLRGVTKTYVSPFGSMQGATDFTAFLK